MSQSLRADGFEQAHGGLLHPLPLAAIGLLVLNDHALKAAVPGPLTGILSDIAGLTFFPLLLVAFLEVGRVACGRFEGPDDRVLLAAVALTGLAFALVELHPVATEVYRVGLAALQHPIDTLQALNEGTPLLRVDTTPDTLDLLALPALAIPLVVGRAQARAREGATTRESGLA